jgi:hypothetical protein
MKIKLKNTPEQVELIKAMGSRRPEESRPAMEAFAAFIGPVVQKVLMQAGTASMIYTDSEYDEDDSPSLPLDLWYDQGANFVQVWFQTMAGGLPSSLVEGLKELKFHTYRLDSAVSFLKAYARKARLDVVSKAVERMTNEVLVKQERNAWAVILKALAEARTTVGSTTYEHVIDANTDNVFQIDDLNHLLTRGRRINVSYANGTPADYSSRGITDLFVSPEVKEQIRSFAYQPMNTRAVPNTDESTALGLPDNVREEIYRAAGTQEIYGVGITELLEFGVAQKYNTLFDTFYGGTVTMADANDEILVGVDLSRDAFIRPVARQAESGGTFTAQPDDQFVSRQEKTGFWGFLEEGRIVTDARALLGLVV